MGQYFGRAAALGAGAYALRGGGEGAGRVADGLPPATATVVRTDLVRSKTVDGKVDFAGRRPVKSAVEGTVTVAACEGVTVTRGQGLYELDDKPVTLLYGPVPAFRELRAGNRGSDVLQLERNLVALGYGSGLYVDPRFDRATEAAVKRWQKSVNRTPTGRVGKGDVVFQPDQVKVASADAALADQMGPGDRVLTVASTKPVVRAELDQSDVSLTAKGTKAEVTLPSGRTEPGRVTGTAAPDAAGKPEDSGPGDAVTVEVTLDGGRSVAADEDTRATASVKFVSEAREDAPVGARRSALGARRRGGRGARHGGDVRLLPRAGLDAGGAAVVPDGGLRRDAADRRDRGSLPGGAGLPPAPTVALSAP
ncbi:peptidoglycan-binding domain-containing protein [Streptomyces sp. G5(2025)]|uniref:peptidoglycan-binding domain-containing protein n=1 Tax=Streptomyces sp. G5(2025) TaxID=3406628 RepID=UPI003C1F4F8D